MATAAGARPLAGVRILDLTRALAGPFCATILADLGAEVVKVEPTPNGEMSRGWGPFDRGISVYYLAVNRNKRSLALDFRAKPAIGLLRDLAGKADVLLENFKPGTMEAMGLSCESLRAASPRLIYANITGFGRTGPYGEWPGLDQIAQGMSGLMSITGQTGGEATRVGVPIGDMIAGMWAALGVQAAVMGVLEMIFIQSDAQAQGLLGVGIAGYLAALVSYMVTPLSEGIWNWAGPILLGAAAYLIAYFSGGGVATGEAHGWFAPLVRVTPLGYTAMGISGALLGYWCSRQWAQPDESEAPETTAVTGA